MVIAKAMFISRQILSNYNKSILWDRISDPELLYNEKYAFVLICYDLDKKICRIGKNTN